MTEEFSGNFDEVSRAIMHFLFRICPNLSLLSKIRFGVDESRIVEEVANVVKFDDVGTVIVADVSDSSDQDLIIIHLSAAYIGYRTGFLEIDRLTVEEMCELTGIKENALKIRLSRLAKKKLVDIPEMGTRKITSRGLAFFVDQILPRLRKKTK